jgi:sec-independent protein translocase protein TatA
MFTGWERPSHWLVLGVVVALLFGYKKLPDAARSLGRSLRIFKTEIKGMGEDDAAREAAKAIPPAAPKPAAPDADPVADDTPTVTTNTEKPAASTE